MNKYFDQPRGFSVFFLTEMWERYGFYIIQTLLILYFANELHLSDARSYTILGSFTALAHINPILGGYIADRMIGAKKSILCGIFLIILGYLILAFIGQKLATIIVALSVISMGSGLLKPNIYSLLGTLYHDNDKRRHAGFTLFYVGLYVGILLATCLGGYIQRFLGWEVTYIIAACVLSLALATFYFGCKICLIKDSKTTSVQSAHYLKSFFLILGVIGINVYITNSESIAEFAFGGIAIISLGIVVYEICRAQGSEKRSLLAYLLLVTLSIFFWAIYFQLYFSVSLFIDRVVDRHFFGFLLPTPFFAGIEALGIIIFGPLLSALWHKLELKKKSPSTPEKFALALLILGLAFTLLFFSSTITNAIGQVIAGWVMLVYGLVAIGELLLSPTGLAMVTELTPKRLWGLMIGIFFVAVGLGGKIAGFFAKYSNISLEQKNLTEINVIYRHAFGKYMIFCFCFSLLSVFSIRLIKNLIEHRVEPLLVEQNRG